MCIQWGRQNYRDTYRVIFFCLLYSRTCFFPGYWLYVEMFLFHVFIQGHSGNNFCQNVLSCCLVYLIFSSTQCLLKLFMWIFTLLKCSEHFWNESMLPNSLLRCWADLFRIQNINNRKYSFYQVTLLTVYGEITKLHNSLHYLRKNIYRSL